MINQTLLIKIPKNIRQLKIKETPQLTVTRKTPFHNNKKKVVVVGNSITKFLCFDELSTSARTIKIMKHHGCPMEDMIDLIKPTARKKPDAILTQVETNELIKSINTVKNVRKCVEDIHERTDSENIQIGLSRIMQRTDKDFS